MKILLLSLNFAPELTGIGKYSGEMANGLVDRGHDVSVVCAPPYYPAWRVEDGHRGDRYRIERPRPGLTVYRCPIWLPDKLGGGRRLLHLASFALSSLPVLLWLVLWNPKLVFVVAPSLFAAPAGWLVARMSGARAWLHVQDFEIDAAFRLGILRLPFVRRGALFFERVLLRRFDAVSTISRRMVRQLATKGISMQDTELVRNWVDLSSVRPGDHSPALRQALGIGPAQLVCLFSGTINRKQGLDAVIEAARLLMDEPEIVFVIGGNGELRTSLEAAAADLSNVRFIDLQPASGLNALLNMADVHLLPQMREAADLVMPSKLGGMLASGRPVVAGAMPGTETGSIVSGCGVLTAPECARGFASAIRLLAADADLRLRLGREGRLYAERMLSSTVILDRLSSRMTTLAEADATLRGAPTPSRVNS